MNFHITATSVFHWKDIFSERLLTYNNALITTKAANKVLYSHSQDRGVVTEKEGAVIPVAKNPSVPAMTN